MERPSGARREHGSATPWLVATIGVVILAIVIILAVVLLVLPGRPPGPPRPLRPPQGTVNAADAAKAAVVVYLQHLQDGDYAAAHGLLSEESRRRHPLEEFKRQAEQGITFYDLASPRVKLIGRGRAEVTVTQEEDPASSTIVAVSEKGAWRIVFVRGRPSQPYP